MLCDWCCDWSGCERCYGALLNSLLSDWLLHRLCHRSRSWCRLWDNRDRLWSGFRLSYRCRLRCRCDWCRLCNWCWSRLWFRFRLGYFLNWRLLGSRLKNRFRVSGRFFCFFYDRFSGWGRVCWFLNNRFGGLLYDRFGDGFNNRCRGWLRFRLSDRRWSWCDRSRCRL